MKSEARKISKAGTRNFAAVFFLLLTVILPGNAHAITDALRIKIAKGSYSDETIIRFLPNATINFDGSHDAWKLLSPNASVPNIWTRIGPGEELSINAIPSFAASITMEVFVKIGTAGTYTISAVELGAFLPEVKIRLKDLATNILYDLRTSNAYAISLPVIASTDSARFQVFFSYPASAQVSNATCSTCTDGVVAVTKAGESGWQYQVKDTAGASIASGFASASTYTIGGLAPGNYTIAITGNFSCTENRAFSVSMTPVLLGATFIEFTAIAGAGIVTLSWTTGMESNTGYFTIERSEDGIHYNGIENIGAAGNSSTLRTYSASDNDPYEADSYYRIKLTDLNGDISYSEIVLVAANNSSLFSVFPNPASEMLTLTLDGHKNSEAMIVIRDMTGREVMSMQTISASGHESMGIIIPSVLAR